jgi:hypothetical protein
MEVLVLSGPWRKCAFVALSRQFLIYSTTPINQRKISAAVYDQISYFTQPRKKVTLR